MAVAAALLSGTISAHAGPCAAQIAQLQKVAQSESPTLPESHNIELHHQPTVRSVENAQNHAKAEAAAAFDRAQKADVRGDAAACAKAVAELKRLYGVS
jgi:hypothetical protein